MTAKCLVVGIGISLLIVFGCYRAGLIDKLTGSNPSKKDIKIAGQLAKDSISDLKTFSEFGEYTAHMSKDPECRDFGVSEWGYWYGEGMDTKTYSFDWDKFDGVPECSPNDPSGHKCVVVEDRYINTSKQKYCIQTDVAYRYYCGFGYEDNADKIKCALIK